MSDKMDLPGFSTLITAPSTPPPPPPSLHRHCQSLDEIITTQRSAKKAAPVAAPAAAAAAKSGRKKKNRAAPYQKPVKAHRPGNPEGQWTHDMYTGPVAPRSHTRGGGSGGGGADLRKLLSRNGGGGGGQQSNGGSGGSMMIDRLGPVGGGPIRNHKGQARAVPKGPISIKGAANTAILIQNFVPGTTVADITVTLQQFGKVVECSMDSPSVCRTVFEKPESATAAIQRLNGATADGRVLKVKEAGISIAGAATRRALTPAKPQTPSSLRGGLYSDRMTTPAASVPAPNKLFSNRTVVGGGSGAVAGARDVFSRVGGRKGGKRDDDITFSITV
ncbi:hypothetical protein HDU86_006216 [Geranomyces michiganensis]|nr:hypothetical protein HDU86_006216 [Geranomyces michiganensis]